MAQILQLKRKTSGAGVPPSLAEGEMAYNTTGQTIVIGDGATVWPLVGADRQVELSGDQTITGNKTIAAANLKLTGGSAGQVLSTTDSAGTLAWIPDASAVPATNAEMDAGALNTVVGTPQNTRALIGAAVTTLTTTAKTVVPAINELKAAVSLLSASQVFVGSFNATTGSIAWTAASGASGSTLPAPAPANTGWYLIAEQAGTAPPGGAPAGTYSVGDQLLSNGSAWTHLALGGSSSVTAGAVSVTPAVAGGSNVQAALESLDLGKVDRSGETMTGVLVLAADPLTNLEAVTKQYVDAKGSALDAADLLRVVKTGDTMTGVLNLSSTSHTGANEATSKTYVDAQVSTKASTTYVDAGDVLRLLKTGDSMTGALQLPVTMPTSATEAAHKGYVDAQLTLLVVDGGSY